MLVVPRACELEADACPAVAEDIEYVHAREFDQRAEVIRLAHPRQFIQQVIVIAIIRIAGPATIERKSARHMNPAKHVTIR
jgi:hypothetical protein